MYFAFLLSRIIQEYLDFYYGVSQSSVSQSVSQGYFIIEDSPG